MQSATLSLFVGHTMHIVRISYRGQGARNDVHPDARSGRNSNGPGIQDEMPALGKGGLFSRFLKIAEHCRACGEEFHHHRADDFPAYLVIVVVGHIIVPAILAVEVAYAPPTRLQLAVWLPLTLISSLALLQPTKGAIVGLQWQAGMHGFAASKQRRLADSEAHLPTPHHERRHARQS